MSDVNFTIFFPEIITDHQLARLLRLICQYSTLVPIKYDTTEPLRLRFLKNKIDLMAARMIMPAHVEPIYFFTTPIKSGRGMLAPRFGKGKRTGDLSLHSDSSEIEMVSSMQQLFKDVARSFGPTYGCLHYLSEPEVNQLKGSDTVMGNASNPLMFGISRWQLVRCLPNLFWANVFGPEYVELFGGRDRMLSAPAPIVEEVAADTFYLQLSENLFDLASKPDEIRVTRKRLKQHLGADCFFDPSKGYKIKHRVPNTGWDEPIRIPFSSMTSEEIIRHLAEEE